MSIELIAIFALGVYLTYLIMKESEDQREYNLEEELTYLLYEYALHAKHSLKENKIILVEFDGLVAEIILEENYEPLELREDEQIIKISFDERL